MFSDTVSVRSVLGGIGQELFLGIPPDHEVAVLSRIFTAGSFRHWALLLVKQVILEPNDVLGDVPVDAVIAIVLRHETPLDFEG